MSRWILASAVTFLTAASPAAGAEDFRRGDVNGDGLLDIADPVRLLFGLFGGLDLACADAADVDDSGTIDLSDVLRELGYLFLAADPPAAPWPDCGFDPTEDSLGCGAHAPCDVPDLTEGRAARFTATSQDYTSVAAFTDDPDAVVGDTSVLWDTGAPFLACAVFPETRNARWDLTRADRLVVNLKPHNENNPRFQGNWPVFVLGKDSGESIVLRPTRNILDTHLDKWRRYEVRFSGGGDFVREDHGTMDLGQVDWFAVEADTWGSGFQIRIDGLAFLPEGPRRTNLPGLDRPDLDVLYIQRRPFYRRYAVDYNDRVPFLHPGTESEKRWPDPGEPVTFHAVVANAGAVPAVGGMYAFQVDGVEVKGGALPALAPDQEVEVTLDWSWEAGPHTVSLSTSLPDGQLEICRLNNALAVRTDSLTFGFSVEQGVKQRMRRAANMYGSFSVADWLRGQVERHMTEGIFLGSTYQPFAPQGVVQRVRIDKLTFVPDGSLPAGGTHALTDRDVDGVWGYGAAGAQEYVNFSGLADTALLHELSHQLGLIDLYQMNLDKTQNDVVPLAFNQDQGGLMGGGTIAPHSSAEGPLYASHDVYGLNSTYGHRRGFYGEYLFSMPAENVLRVLDPEGAQLAGATVRLYQKENGPGGYRIDATAEIEGTSDAAGELPLPNRPVIEVTTATGHSLKANPFGQVSVVGQNGLFLVEVISEGRRGFAFLPITILNLAWARGETDRAVHEVRVAWWPAAQ